MEPIIVLSEPTTEKPGKARCIQHRTEPSTSGLREAIRRNPEVFRDDVYGFDAVLGQLARKR